MDDKTKVELCKKMIEEYLLETGGGRTGRTGGDLECGANGAGI